MKNLIMLIALTFSLVTVNAQSTKKSCSKGASKSCCSKGAKSCSKSSKKSCGSSQAAYSKVVSPNEFVAYMNRFPAEQVIDLRTKKEIKATGMIDGAKNLDFYSDDFKEEANKLNKDVAIMVYCRSGGRSAKAAEMLKQWGFKKIYDMEGGYNAYMKAFPKK